MHKSTVSEIADAYVTDTADVPDAPKSVELTELMPDGAVLTVEPPNEDGGMPVIGYRVRVYRGDDFTHDVTASGICMYLILKVVNHCWHVHSSSIPGQFGLL